MDALIELFHLLLVTPMTNVLVALARLFGGNFGIAIIVFTLLMRLITWPLTSSQYKASRAMQEIQPRLQELQKKYKGKDPKKLQQETMALYKEAGINPLGCLIPFLVQMPIWIALYQVIRLSLGETPESFVSLSQTLYPIPYVHSAIPLDNQFMFWNLGVPDTTFILPAMVALTMYVQQKLITPRPASGQLTAQQQQQQQTQQMMTWMMPFMFGFFSLSVPAGLALYWAVTNIAGIALQYFYMGKTLQWSSLFSFGGAPAAVPPAQTSKSKPAAKPVVETDAGDEEATGTEGGAQTGTRAPQSARRTRHGRRRSKR